MLDRLTPSQQTAMMELLIYMAKTDGSIAEIERDVLQRYSELLNVDTSLLRGDLTPEELIVRFDTPASRVILLQELLRIAHLDGYFTDAEMSAIVDVAALMGFPMFFLEKINDWVKQGLQWVLSGERLIDEAKEVIRL
jgi:uncharacterized tellurite resistance protein B-like protein